MLISIISATIAIAVLMLVIFIISLIKKDNSIIDALFGLVAIIAASVVMTSWATPTAMGMAAYVFLFIWGARLVARMLSRNFRKGEDWRYAQCRQTWMSRSKAYFYTRSFFEFYVLEGIQILILLLPVLAAMSATTTQIPKLAFIGGIVWVIGFVFESIGDEQLDKFKKNPENKGRILQSGLWKYTRHPNYFGEIVMWWGMWIVALGIEPSLWWTIASPLLMTYRLLKVSGVKEVEKKYEGNAEFESYKARTAAVFPRPPKAA